MFKEEDLKTFILMWNPEISSVKMADWRRFMDRFPFEGFNWSVWEYEKVDWRSRCYMVRVGNGNTGLVMKGNFIGDPKKGDDWSDRGRDTYYCDINPWNILDPETQPIITTEELQKFIPSFDWTGGHSGRLLTKEETKKLNKLWDKYYKEHESFMKNQERQFEYCIDKNIAHKIKGFENLVEYFKNDWHEAYEEDPDCIFMERYYGDTVNLAFGHDYETGTFTLRYMLQNAVLPIICTNVHNIKMDLDDESTWMDWFRITSIYKDCFLLEANGIKVVCDNLAFGKVEAYEEDSYPVNI